MRSIWMKITRQEAGRKLRRDTRNQGWAAMRGHEMSTDSSHIR